MEVTIKCSQEEIKIVINSIQAELEGTMKHWVEDILACRPKDIRPLQGN
jgi:hypothetical protein